MKYANAAAFRKALETRLNATAQEGGRPIGRARKLVAFSRLLARLERAAPGQWALKGGFALELRVAGKARATKDVDIDWATSLEDATEALLAATALDLDDYFEFEIERVTHDDHGGGGGARFRGDALLGGRLFERLPIDVGVGDLCCQRMRSPYPTFWHSPRLRPRASTPSRSSSTSPTRCTRTRGATGEPHRARGRKT